MSEDLSLSMTDDSDAVAGEEQDFEEICSDEVDRVIEALEALGASTASENIRHFLDEAANQIYDLIYDDEEELPHEEAA